LRESTKEKGEGSVKSEMKRNRKKNLEQKEKKVVRQDKWAQKQSFGRSTGETRTEREKRQFGRTPKTIEREAFVNEGKKRKKSQVIQGVRPRSPKKKRK